MRPHAPRGAREEEEMVKTFKLSLKSGRSEAPPNPEKAQQLAKELFEAGENRLGTNEVVFNRILAAESFAQLSLVVDAYQRLTGHGIEKAIKKEMSSDEERAFVSLGIRFLNKRYVKIYPNA